MVWSFIAVCAIYFQVAHGHSWLECSNYNPASFDHKELGGFDRSKCSGYPRAFGMQFNAGFGIDTGYNWEHPMCTRDPFREGDYSEQIPMATYQAGQTIYLSHPAKNHVADSCTNPFIPSTSMKVMMSTEVGVDGFDYSLPMVGGDHVNGQIDFLGYQRCFDFCSNPDKSHCLTAWELPLEVSEGRHSFLWVWEFNPGQFYSNCFDAYVSSGAPVDESTAMESEMVSMSGSSSSSTSSSFDGSVDEVAFPSPMPTKLRKTRKPYASRKPRTNKPSDMPMPTESNFPVPTPEMSDDSRTDAMPIFPDMEETETPRPTTPEVMSKSGSAALVPPIVDLGNYIINFMGYLNISRLAN